MTINLKDIRQQYRMQEKHILLAEDNSGLQVTLTLMFRQEKYRVTVARNGHEAFDTISSLQNGPKKVDLLITDLQSVLNEGDELLIKLARADISLPVIILSENMGIELDGTIKTPGNRRFISKPFEAHELMNCVYDLIDQPQQ